MRYRPTTIVTILTIKTNKTTTDEVLLSPIKYDDRGGYRNEEHFSSIKIYKIIKTIINIKIC